jgi:hypothetical protein
MDQTQRNAAGSAFATLSDENTEAMAWLAYLKSVQIAERFDSSSPEIPDEIYELITHAEERDGANLMVSAISGHIRALLFGDLEAAAERFSIVSQNYSSPTLSRILLAMFNNYVDRPIEAIEVSQPLQKFGIGSKFEFIFKSPALVGSFLSRDFKSAIRIGERLTSMQPGFLGAQRYLFASYVLDGKMDLAEKCLISIHERDKDFSCESINSGAYPIPTKAGRKLISDAFSRF